MGELGRISRWSVPGSVVLITAGLVVLGMHGAVHIWAPAHYHGLAMPAFNASIVALLIAASVPVGFMTYQIYYFSYARPQGLIFSFVHMDLALEMRNQDALAAKLVNDETWVAKWTNGIRLRVPFHARVPFTGPFMRTIWLYKSNKSGDAVPAREPGDLPDAVEADVALGSVAAHPGTKWRRWKRIRDAKHVLVEHAERREANWLALETELRNRLRAMGDCDRDFDEVDRLADIFHTLGAAKSALTLGWIAGVGLVYSQLVLNHAIWTNAGVAAAIAAAVGLIPIGGLYIALHLNRAHCSRRRIELIKAILGPADSAIPGSTVAS